jgi:hypothetical protein
MAAPSLLISGLGNNLAQLSSSQREAVAELRNRLGGHEGRPHPNVSALADYLAGDGNLVRFLLAREWDVPAAEALLLEALTWRAARPVHRWFAAGPPPEGVSDDVASDAAAGEHAVCAQRAELFRRHASLGKIRVPGVDIANVLHSANHSF